MKNLEAKCENCAHAIYKNLWGEFKCGLKGRICEDSEVIMGCDDFKPLNSRSDKPDPEIVVRSGATFTPKVSEEGLLSWTNDKGLQNPKPVNIKGPAGKEGEPGKDGYSPVKGVDYFDGEPGKDGQPGKDGSAIIDVLELPTKDIDDRAIYRLMTVGRTYNREVWWECRCVESLPEVGDPYYNGFYYSVTDNDVYVYLYEEMANEYGVPVGWHKISDIWGLIGLPYGGLITDIDDDPCDDTVRFLISYCYYIHKNGWVQMIFAQDKSPKIDIRWDGNPTEHETFSLDGVHYIKVSDIVYAEEQLLGVTMHCNDGYSETIDENNIYTESPGAMIVANDVIIISSITDFANSVGLPEGVGSNGVWFANHTNELNEGVYYVSHLVGEPKIAKIPAKYLEMSEKELYLTSPNGTRFNITITDDGVLTTARI